MAEKTSSRLDIRPYDEIPEVTRNYVDFIFNVADLGEGMEKLYHIEDQRIKLHERMVAEYGLRYEYTRQAVCFPYHEIIAMRPEKVAQVIDSNLRRILETQVEARSSQ